MRKLILAAALLSPALSYGGDPAVDAFKKKFASQEQVLLSGVLADPEQAREFAADANAGDFEAVKLKWYGRISAFSADYLSKPHAFNDKAPDVRSMAEPAEWAMLMATLRKMKDGGILEQGKMKIFIGMIDDANADLKRGDTEAARKVVTMGRGELVTALNEYLASANGKTGSTEAERARREEQARKVVEKAPPAKPAQPATKPVPETKEPTVPGPTSDDELARKAREQAEKIRAELRNGGDGSKGYAGDRNSGGSDPVVAGGGTSESGLKPADKSGAKSNLVVKAPPSPEGESDDMDELHKMKEDVKGNKTLFATIGGGLLGGLIGGLIGMLFGPVGIIIGAIAGAAAGAYGGNALGKKLWG